jgi:clan AA aspartic protease
MVRSDEARVRLSLIGTNGKRQETEAVIDTGFTASLSLPPSIVAELGLHWQTVNRAILADGSECLFDVFEAENTRRVLVDEADTDPLIGMAILRGHELKMQVRNRGKITIKRLPTK